MTCHCSPVDPYRSIDIDLPVPEHSHPYRCDRIYYIESLVNLSILAESVLFALIHESAHSVMRNWKGILLGDSIGLTDLDCLAGIL